MKKAIVFGASGFIGSYLLRELLNDPDYERVTIVVRRDLKIAHPKLTTLLGDYNSLPNLEEKIIGDDVFIALGTTRKNSPNKEDYYQIDHDYPVLAARIAKENGAKTVSIVTAIGANENSSVFYVKTKGEVERDVIALGLERTQIFRPSMLMGDRKENRPFEKIFMKAWSFFNPVLQGNLKKYRGIDGKDVAKAMVQAAKMETGKVRIYYWKDINDLANQNRK